MEVNLHMFPLDHVDESNVFVSKVGNEHGAGGRVKEIDREMGRIGMMLQFDLMSM